MRGVNKVILVGTLGRDPETKQFPNGGSVTQFSIATSESWTDKNTGERKEQTEWHRIVLNNRLGEIAQQYLRKGSKVYIEGSLRTRQWTDQNGQERYMTEVRGDQLQMLDSRNNNGGDYQNQNYANPNQGSYGNQSGYNNQNYGNNAGGFQQQGGNYGQQGFNSAPQDFNQQNNFQQNQGYNSASAPAPSTASRPMNDNEPDDDLPF